MTKSKLIAALILGVLLIGFVIAQETTRGTAEITKDAARGEELSEDDKCIAGLREGLIKELSDKSKAGFLQTAKEELESLSSVYDSSKEFKCVITGLKLSTHFMQDRESIVINDFPPLFKTLTIYANSEINYKDGRLHVTKLSGRGLSYGARKYNLDFRDQEMVIEEGRVRVVMQSAKDLDIASSLDNSFRYFRYKAKYGKDNVVFAAHSPAENVEREKPLVGAEVERREVVEQGFLEKFKRQVVDLFLRGTRYGTGERLVE